MAVGSMAFAGRESYASAAAGTAVDMTPREWLVHGHATFAQATGSRPQTLKIESGSAELKGVTFRTGTIAFDVKLIQDTITGITFRQRGQTADVLYFRPQQNCAASIDCMQYMPINDGIFQWDLYPEDQTRAPLRTVGWNHVEMIVSGHRMLVYVNGARSPTLSVGRLEGAFADGTIKLHGPASYANVRIAAGKVDGLPDVAAIDPAANDRRYIRRWAVSKATRMATTIDPVLHVRTGLTPAYDSVPPASSWQPLKAEPSGLVNLSRRYGSVEASTTMALAWLKTRVISNEDRVVRVSIGWVREIWVYDGGKLIFASKNLYDLPLASKPPDGSLSLQNGSFALPLHRGSNDIVVALDDNFLGGSQRFGWGLKMKLADERGIVAAPL